MHEKLLKIVRTLQTDYEPYGKVERDSSDCSSGCRHFVKLAGDVGEEWGVCANPESARAGLLTFEHQGCPEFEPMLLDRALTDSQLRFLIGEASEILKDRRRERMDSVAAEETLLPNERGEFIYDLKTSYFPHIKGHAPVIFRLEPHDGGFVAVSLASRTTGSQRPTLMGRHPAKNGEVFKIVRANGEYSYQVPYNGKIYNLKQFGNLSGIGILGLETLRRFLECVEPETFEKITSDARKRLKHAKRSLDDNRDRITRWKKREFWGDETPANKREYQEMLKEAEEEVDNFPPGSRKTKHSSNGCEVLTAPLPHFALCRRHHNNGNLGKGSFFQSSGDLNRARSESPILTDQNRKRETANRISITFANRTNQLD